MKKLLFISMFAALLAAGCGKEDIFDPTNPDSPNYNPSNPNNEIIPTDEIWYTTSDGEIVKMGFSTADVGIRVVSNTYENGKGIIKLNVPVTKIGIMAFRNLPSLTSIAIPNSVTIIDNYAFFECSSLTSVTIPDSVKTIREYAFGCCGFTSVTIPDSVTSIGVIAFGGCSSLTAFYGKFASEDNRCLIINGVLNSFAPYGLTEYTIPYGVTSIRDRAFVICRSLTSINIPDSVTEIESGAFYNCSSLTSITIPDSVTEIGYKAFYGCSSLTAFYGKFASADNRCLIVDGVLNSFAIGCGATEYTIPDGVSEIGYGAFYSCRSLTSITIPDSVTTIGAAAFEYCHSLTSVYCKAATPPTLRSDVFKYYVNGEHYILENLTAIYVPRESVEAYKAAENWSEYAHLIQPYDF